MDSSAQEDARTVFVRGLPFNFTDSQVEEIFSELGPVRRAFTVKDKESGKHRGVAFVQFALAEDASQAIAAKHGAAVEGRKIHVELAKRRAPLSERVKKKKGVQKLEQEQVEATTSPGGATEEENNSAVRKRRSEVEKGEGASKDVPNKKKQKKAKTSEPEAPSQKQKSARTVVLGGFKGKENLLSILDLAKQLGTVESINDELSQEEIDEHDLAKDGCKLRAASVVFTSVKAAREAVETFHRQRYGDSDVWARQLGGEGSKWRKWRLIIRNLPFKVTEKALSEKFSEAGFVWEVKLPTSSDGRSKGFGFVSYTNKQDAEKAIKNINATKISNRPIAVDWSIPKSKYEVVAKNADDENEETASESEAEDGHVTKQNGNEVEAMGDKAGAMNYVDAEEEDAEIGDPANEVELVSRVLTKFISPPDAQEKEVKGKKKAKERIVEHNEEIGTDSKDSSKTEKDDAMDRTLFVRNLPVDAKVQDLKQRFSKFGVVKSLRPVLHPITKKPKGTAFLEFETREAAEKAVEAAKEEDGTSNFMIGTKAIIVHFAVDRNSARDISKKKSKEEEDRDRRNLHLITEGLIKKGMAAAEGVSEADLAKRKALELEKATKLRSPIFHVSRTRLAFHNFPKTTTVKEVKKMFIDAVKSRATKQRPVIKQVKLLEDDKGMSRGAGFVEFLEHQHALVALRVLNNNPQTFGAQKRPIVEFAIDNVQKLLLRESRLAASRQKGPGHNSSRDGSTGEFKDKRKSETLAEGESNAKEKRKRDNSSAEDDKRSHLKKKRKVDGADKDALQIAERNKPKKQKHGQAEYKMKPAAKRDKQPAKQPAAKRDKQPAKQPAVAKENKQQVKDKGKQKPATDASNERRRGRQKEREIEDKLDKLVSEYRNKYFGGSKAPSAAGTSQQQTTLGNIKRWFD